MTAKATEIARADNPMTWNHDREAVSAHRLTNCTGRLRAIDAFGQLPVGDSRPRRNQTGGIPDRALKPGTGWRLDVIEIHQLTAHGVQKSAAEIGEEARIGRAERLEGSTVFARAVKHLEPTGLHVTRVGPHDVERPGRGIENSMTGDPAATRP